METVTETDIKAVMDLNEIRKMLIIPAKADDDLDLRFQEAVKSLSAEIPGIEEIHDQLPGALGETYYRPTWNKKRSIMFLSIRKWDRELKSRQVAEMRSQKAVCDHEFVSVVAKEFAAVINMTIAGIRRIGPTVTAPPHGSKTKLHFASEVARAIAEEIGGHYLQVFRRRPRKIKPGSKHYGERTDPVLNKAPASFCLLIDDVATTGTTLEQSISLLKQYCSVMPIVWIYGEQGGVL